MFFSRFRAKSLFLFCRNTDTILFFILQATDGCRLGGIVINNFVHNYVDNSMDNYLIST